MFFTEGVCFAPESGPAAIVFQGQLCANNSPLENANIPDKPPLDQSVRYLGQAGNLVPVALDLILSEQLSGRIEQRLQAILAHEIRLRGSRPLACIAESNC